MVPVTHCLTMFELQNPEEGWSCGGKHKLYFSSGQKNRDPFHCLGIQIYQLKDNLVLQ